MLQIFPADSVTINFLSIQSTFVPVKALLFRTFILEYVKRG